MSKNKIRKPKNKTPELPIGPTLELDPTSLVKEWRGLSGQIAAFAQQIQQHQDTQRRAIEAIQKIEKQGLQFVGQIHTITKILTGMGIDPKTFDLDEEEILDENLPSEPPKEAEVVAIKGDDPEKTLRSRFHKS